MKKKRSVGSYAAASRKAWRTRKQMMEEARRTAFELMQEVDLSKPITAIEIQRRLLAIEARKLLPNPWLEMKFK